MYNTCALACVNLVISVKLISREWRIVDIVNIECKSTPRFTRKCDIYIEPEEIETSREHISTNDRVGTCSGSCVIQFVQIGCLHDRREYLCRDNISAKLSTYVVVRQRWRDDSGGYCSRFGLRELSNAI